MAILLVATRFVHFGALSAALRVSRGRRALVSTGLLAVFVPGHARAHAGHSGPEWPWFLFTIFVLILMVGWMCLASFFRERGQKRRRPPTEE